MTGGGGGQAGHVDVVLDGEGYAVKRQVLASSLLDDAGSNQQLLPGKATDPDTFAAGFQARAEIFDQRHRRESAACVGVSERRQIQTRSTHRRRRMNEPASNDN